MSVVSRATVSGHSILQLRCEFCLCPTMQHIGVICIAETLHGPHWISWRGISSGGTHLRGKHKVKLFLLSFFLLAVTGCVFKYELFFPTSSFRESLKANSRLNAAGVDLSEDFALCSSWSTVLVSHV